MNKTVRNKRIKFYIVYTLLFAFFMCAILYAYYSKGKTMAHYGGDGYRQFYRALLYISNYYKQIFHNIFIEHNFIIPQWDFVIGEGSDILEALHYYGLGDPLNLFSVFFNEDNLHIFFDLCIFLRMYLSGIVFSRLCFYKKNNNYYAVLTGSILYAYCNYAILVMSTHITFLNALLYFPLVILGVEKLIENNKHALLIASVFLISITSIYFFYMVALLTAFYSIIRIALLEANIKQKFQLLFKITAFSIVGLLISSFIFLPTAYSMLNNSRIANSNNSQLLYSLDYYLVTFTSIIFNGYQGSFLGGYTILGFLSILYVFKRKEDNKLLKILLISIFIMLVFPFFGKLLNAMTYVTNRWQFCISLLMCYCIVTTFDEIAKLHIRFLIVFVIYSVLSAFYHTSEWQVYLLYLTLGSLFMLSLKFTKRNKVKYLLCLGVAIFTLSFNLYYKYSSNYWDFANNGTDVVVTQESNSLTDVFDSIDDGSFYRYSGDSLPDNIDINGNKSSTGYYWSVANDDVMEFRNDVALLDTNNHHYNNYDDDYMLNCLASVKYFLSNNGAPYNYSFYKDYDDYGIYINNDSLPLVYGYSDYISKNNWLELSVLERREALSNYVVLEETIDSCTFSSRSEEIEYFMSCDASIDIKDKKIYVNSADSKIKIVFDYSKDGDYYLLLKGLKTNSETTLIVETGNGLKSVVYKTEDNVAYAGRHDFLVNIGNKETIDDGICIGFTSTGEYKYDSISIIRLPLNEIEQNLKNLNCVDINDMTISTNNIKMDIIIEEDKYLCFSIPHYSGWEAYLDGKEVELFDYNIMYMGFFATSGSHRVELVYNTPLLKEGTEISAVSLFCFILYEIINAKHTKTKNVI